MSRLYNCWGVVKSCMERMRSLYVKRRNLSVNRILGWIGKNMLCLVTSLIGFYYMYNFKKLKKLNKRQNKYILS